MTTIYINFKSNQFNVVADGHAGFNDNGHDIVCSAVSALLYSCVGSILNLQNDGILSTEESGHYTIDCTYTDRAVYGVFMSMTIGLAQIALAYPNNVKIILNNTQIADDKSCLLN